jgi:predicted nucleic acid-binding protein
MKLTRHGDIVLLFSRARCNRMEAIRGLELSNTSTARSAFLMMRRLVLESNAAIPRLALAAVALLLHLPIWTGDQDFWGCT